MIDITIPDEAVEAASFYLPGYHSRDLHAHVRAAIRAAIEAWPGMSTGPNIYGRQDAIMHLPLPPQENSDE